MSDIERGGECTYMCVKMRIMFVQLLFIFPMLSYRSDNETKLSPKTSTKVQMLRVKHQERKSMTSVKLRFSTVSNFC